ncbi:MAG: magnesium transporter, partial [Pseudomonadota bacterium]
MAEPQDSTDEEAFGITEALLSDVMEAVGGSDGEAVDAILEPLHPADIAHLLEQIDERDRRALLAVWSDRVDGEVLSELDDHLREEVMEQLAPAELAEAVRDLDSDDVVDLVEYL